jgi:chemotaxis protein CheX
MEKPPTDDLALLPLDPILDLKAASGLHAEFLARRGRDLMVDASEVRRLGGQCLQILLAATTAWGADGQKLSFENPSEAFEQALSHFGIHFDNGFQSLCKEPAV